MIIILAWRAKNTPRLIFLCEVKILKWKKQVTAAKKNTLVLRGFISFLMIASSFQSFTSSYLTHTHTHTLWLLLKQLYDTVSFPQVRGQISKLISEPAIPARFIHVYFYKSVFDDSVWVVIRMLWLVMLIITILEMKKSVMIFKTLTVFLI